MCVCVCVCACRGCVITCKRTALSMHEVSANWPLSLMFPQIRVVFVHFLNVIEPSATTTTALTYGSPPNSSVQILNFDPILFTALQGGAKNGATISLQIF